MSTHTRSTPARGLLVLLAGSALVGCTQEPARPEGAPAGSARPVSTATRAAPASDEPDGTTIVPAGGELPGGTYRVEFSDAHLAEHGLEGEQMENNRGVWTTTLEEGRWTVEQVAAGLVDTFSGVYEVRESDLFWRFHDTGKVLHLRWQTDESGDLHFTQVTPGSTDFQFALEWTKTQ